MEGMGLLSTAATQAAAGEAAPVAPVAQPAAPVAEGGGPEGDVEVDEEAGAAGEQASQARVR